MLPTPGTGAPSRTLGHKAHLRALVAARSEDAPDPGPAGTLCMARGRRPDARARVASLTVRQ